MWGHKHRRKDWPPPRSASSTAVCMASEWQGCGGRVSSRTQAQEPASHEGRGQGQRPHMGALRHGVRAAATHHTVARHTALLLYTRQRIEAHCGANTPRTTPRPDQDAATATVWPGQHGTGNKATCCTKTTPASGQSGAPTGGLRLCTAPHTPHHITSHHTTTATSLCQDVVCGTETGSGRHTWVRTATASL
jgi:hypothetical protein